MARNAGSRAFTLLEMVVALAIFAVIGVMSSRILAGVVELSDVVRDRGEALSELQRAVAIVERDIEQGTRRSVRDGWGDTVEAIVAGDQFLLELTRLGWQNPLAEPRSELQRVAYAMRDDMLLRVYWPVLDRAPETEPVTQILLTGLDGASFVVYDSGGEEHRHWPQPPRRDDEPAHAAAIALELDSTTFGRIERLWMLPAQASGLSYRPRLGAPGDEAPAGTPEREP